SCQIDADGKELSVSLVPWLHCDYWLRFQDSRGLASDYKNEMRIIADPPPAITLQRPGSSLSLLPDARVTFAMTVTDEKFAVRSVHVEYRRKSAEGKWLDATPRRLPILDPDVFNRDMPALLAALGPGNIPSGVTLRSRPTHLELNSRWP